MKQFYNYAIALSFLAVMAQGANAQTNDPTETVDLGLKSGLLWATKNIGAEAAEEVGEYYQWGYTEVQERCEWEGYKFAAYYGDWDDIPLLKYNNNPAYGTVDNLMTLEPEDDVATQKFGAEWHVPTKEEYLEMINGCNWSADSVKFIDGSTPRIIFVGESKANGNKIYFPCCGNMSIMIGKPHVFNDKSFGFYWTSSLTDSLCVTAAYAYFGTVSRQYVTEPFIRNERDRVIGMNIRAVKSAKSNSVDNIEATEQRNALTFDLTGKQVDPKSLKTGVYIRGGKKFFVK